MRAEKLHPEYVTDSVGRRKAVILPVEEFDGLLEDLDDLACVAERRNEPTVAHAKVMEDLNKDGYLQG
ncbi:hypothetical protein JXA88_12900 [Candidatus Fermentibacteria bacterium]|nr:hypothetical protein [Candidatus Fermentibacteria bacterium]